MAKQSVNIGLIGLGTVGGGVAELLLAHKKRLSNLIGAELNLVKAADMDQNLAHGLGLADGVYTPDGRDVINDPNVDIVVELIGGLEPARTLVLEAIAAGKHVATANKALLAHHGRENIQGCGTAQGRRGLRGLCGRRHTADPLPARRPCRQQDQLLPGHPQRHLQLHPQRDDRQGRRVRRRAQSGPGGGLCRGRPHL